MGDLRVDLVGDEGRDVWRQDHMIGLAVPTSPHCTIASTLMGTAMNDNSLFYWSHRSEGDWEDKGGRVQSRFFYRLAVREMPSWLTAAIRRNRLAVCDWGCALGDGTDALAHALGTSVTGIDFSEVAITKARESYSKPRFLAIDLLTEPICETWDVVFSSNTLEHFAEPWRTLASIARFATSVLVVLVPYREFERHHEHEYTFLDTNIPLSIDAFELRHVALIDAASEPASMWNGNQILLVYTSREFAEELRLCLGDIRVDGDWTSKELERLRTEVTAWRSRSEMAQTRLNELEASMPDARLAVEERDCQLAEPQKTNEELERHARRGT
jgi:SAM-dependent methyltransferase